jgi:hypothetical protein
MKGHPIKYSQAELAFIKQRKRMARRKLHAKFIAAFPRRRDVSLDALKALCKRKGWMTGRDGCFEKGTVPFNKGKKMPFHPNSARTRFKKGNRTGKANLIYKPIGTERFSKEGYLERKIHDGLPMQSRWRAVHIVNWEKLNGPVPKKHCLKCLDGDKLNTDPSNWELISRAVLVRLSGKSSNQYDRAPTELKPTVMAIAKLKHRLSQQSTSQE